MLSFRSLVAAAALALPAGLATGCASGVPGGGTLGLWGRTLEAADEETGRPAGVAVLRLHGDSPLLAQGVRKGDIIVSVEGKPPGSTADLERRVFNAGWEKPLRMEIRRGEETREITVQPAAAYRTLRLGLGIPFLWGSPEDAVEILPFSLFRIGTGPDYKGFMILSCIGFETRPESNDFWLVIFHTGTGYGPPVARPKKHPDEDLLTLPQ
jgi:hypothetical protein